MKTLFFDCSMGAAGDMLTAALMELLPDPDGFVQEFNSLGIPGVQMIREPSCKCGIVGTHVSISVNGVEEDEDLHTHTGHVHEHGHTHAHGHMHTAMQDVRRILLGTKIPESIQKDILSVYDLIAQAESHAHGMPIEQIHFHEVGTMDAIADVTAVCMLMDRLHPDYVAATPIHTGAGTVHCAHGILPVPAPATAFILQGVPIYSGSIQGELCTPTGAALLKHFVNEFGVMRPVIVEAIGYGMGKKDFPQANCVRAMFGESAEKACVATGRQMEIAL